MKTQIAESSIEPLAVTYHLNTSLSIILTMHSIDIPEDIRYSLAQQLPNIIKNHPEPHALQYLLKQLKSANSISDFNRNWNSRVVTQSN
jgi:hypothetical protein